MNNYVGLLLLLLLFSCDKTTELRAKKSPLGTLLDIEEAEKAGDRKTVETLIYGVDSSIGNSKVLLTDGIMNKLGFGNFSYSPESFEYIANNLQDNFTPLSDSQIESYISREGALFNKDAHLKELLSESRLNFMYFNYILTQMIFVKDESLWKLLFSTNGASIIPVKAETSK